MEFITILEATQRYNKSISTIKRYVGNAKAKDVKKGVKLNTGKYKVLISVGYLNSCFIDQSQTTENNKEVDSSDYIKALKEQTESQQRTIDKLLHNQEQFLERQREQNILLERATKRNELLEQHFNRNRLKEAEEVIDSEEIIEDEIVIPSAPKQELNEHTIPSDRAGFNDWMKSFKSVE